MAALLANMLVAFGTRQTRRAMVKKGSTAAAQKGTQVFNPTNEDG